MHITRRILQSIAVVSIILFILVLGTSFISAPTSALTVDEIQIKIQELLTKIDELKRQLAQAQSTPSVEGERSHRICAILNRNLGIGARGEDVSALQEFLREQGRLQANASGYFGPATARAVAEWQTSEGVTAAGSFGPISRERLKAWCGQGADRFAASPQRGAAPLAVTFKTNVDIANPQFVADAGDYKIVFGDGGEQKISCTNTDGFCKGVHTVTHTYTKEGTYRAQLVHYGYFGLPSDGGGMPQRVVGQASIVVGVAQEAALSVSPQSGEAPLTAQFTFHPTNDDLEQYWISYGDGRGEVMQKRVIYCITTPCISPNFSSHTYNASGSYTVHVSRYIACLHGTNGPVCKIAEPPPLATATVTVTGSSANRPPIISSFTGPSTLSVHQTGTWIIKASDPESGPLNYTIDWGDTAGLSHAPSSAARAEFQQTTTFTHSYPSTGSYTIKITVRDSSGKDAVTTSTVRVGAEMTYCTADAMLCPDGSYVGRTGPNCQFVCPSTSPSEGSGNCPTGYGWCPAGASGYSCGLLTNGQCPAVF